MSRNASRLQEQLKQRKPFRSLAQEAFVGLLRTADVVRRSYGGVLAAGELTVQQYNVLRILRGAGTASYGYCSALSGSSYPRCSLSSHTPR